MSAARAAGATVGGPQTVYFTSDYGLDDEFVGVVHAVLRRLAPDVGVIDLTHLVPAFDVAAGAAVLVRALPHLGPGAVLAVVDPGVGGRRRPVALQTRSPHGDLWLVGPDNGLLVAAAESSAGVLAAVHLHPADPPAPSATFDGRDLFAPAVAALCTGTPPSSLGRMIDPASLHRLAAPTATRRRSADGLTELSARVQWVDRFGNAQLNVGAAGSAVPPTVELRRVVAASHPGPADVGPGAHAGGLAPPTRLRRVGAFSELGPSELGLLADANGQLAVVARDRPAARLLHLRSGDEVRLVW